MPTEDYSTGWLNHAGLVPGISLDLGGGISDKQKPLGPPGWGLRRWGSQKPKLTKKYESKLEFMEGMDVL